MMIAERISGVSFLLENTNCSQLEMELTPEQQARYELKPRTVESAKRDTKTIGDISEMHVVLAMRKRGYDVSVPLGENHRYDIVVDDGEKLSRIQVKTGRIRGGVIRYIARAHMRIAGGQPVPTLARSIISPFTAQTTGRFISCRRRN